MTVPTAVHRAAAVEISAYGSGVAVGAGGSAVTDVHFFEIRHIWRPAEVSLQLYLIATLCSAAGTSHFAKDPVYSLLQGRLPTSGAASLPTNRAVYSVLIASATYCVALAT